VPKIIPIVEGDGEKNAFPILLRRLLHETYDRYDVEISSAKSAYGRPNLTKPNGLEKFLNYAAIEKANGIIVLLDADEDCAVELACALGNRTQQRGLTIPTVIVCAKCEYEAWFLASLATVAGKKGIKTDAAFDGDVEAKRNVKGWLSAQMPAGTIYKETLDQASLTANIDFTLARAHSRSFRRLEHAVEQLLDAIDHNRTIVTPLLQTE